jgi:hypothetical protein
MGWGALSAHRVGGLHANKVGALGAHEMVPFGC